MEETKEQTHKAKKITINVEFQDVNDGIFRGLIEVKTFDLKDFLKDRGYTFEGRASGEVRNNQAVKIFTQKREFYGTDKNNVRGKLSKETDDILKIFYVKMLDTEQRKEETNNATKKNT